MSGVRSVMVGEGMVRVGTVAVACGEEQPFASATNSVTVIGSFGLLGSNLRPQ